MAELGQMPGDARKRLTDEGFVPSECCACHTVLKLRLEELIAAPFDTLEVEAAENVVELVKVVRADDIRILLGGGQP